VAPEEAPHERRHAGKTTSPQFKKRIMPQDRTAVQELAPAEVPEHREEANGESAVPVKSYWFPQMGERHGS
jgi:hypothetical protein